MTRLPALSLKRILLVLIMLILADTFLFPMFGMFLHVPILPLVGAWKFVG